MFNYPGQLLSCSDASNQIHSVSKTRTTCASFRRASRSEEASKSKKGWALPKASKGNQVQPLNTGKVGISCQQSATVLHSHGSDPDVV